MGKTIRNKALGRGLTIGAIDTLSGGLAGKATTSVLKGGKTAARTRKIMAAAAGVGVEAVGGATGAYNSGVKWKLKVRNRCTDCTSGDMTHTPILTIP